MSWTGGNPFAITEISLDMPDLDWLDADLVREATAKIHADLEREIMSSLMIDVTDTCFTKLDVILDNSVTPVVIHERELFSGHLRITVLDEDPEVSAGMLCDLDVRRCVTDFAYILKEATREHPEQHPSVLWARNAVANWQWLVEYFERVIVEHKHRFKSFTPPSIDPQLHSQHPPNVQGGRSTTACPPPQQVPEEYRTSEQTQRWKNVIQANRQFYLHELYTARWSTGSAPPWFIKDTRDLEDTLAAAGVKGMKTTVVKNQPVPGILQGVTA